MAIFDIFKSKKKVDCQSFKDSTDIYPQNSVSLVMVQTEYGKPVTGWVDLGYIDYKFKSVAHLI